jgi:beta-lactamase class A
MIILSDNTATNVVIDAVGMENVTSRMAALGLTERSCGGG